MPEAPAAPDIVAFGESAFLVRLGERVDLPLNREVHWLARRIDERMAGDPRWRRAIPAYASVLVAFDADELDPAAARADLEAVVLAGRATEGAAAGTAGRAAIHEIPVHYGGAAGPDLEAVAKRLRLAPADVMARHAGTTYAVFMLGFTPGFPYLGVLPAELELPRLRTPRTRVPAGSVAIAGRQTGIYPFETPGGWHLIGRTDARLWDLDRVPPAMLAPGDEVRFVPA
jgi:KipI family sensor histidine kinase inhibitor